MYLVSRLQFDNDVFLHEEIGSKVSHWRATKIDGHRPLAFTGDTALVQSDEHCTFVDRLEKTGTKIIIDVKERADDLTREILMKQHEATGGFIHGVVSAKIRLLDPSVSAVSSSADHPSTAR